MKIGLMVPLVPRDANTVLQMARLADENGVDGLFVGDHLTWNGHDAYSAFPMLGAIAAATEGIHVGTLVARVGVRPQMLLNRDFETLQDISNGRLIAGLGVGDGKSRAENDVYGLPPVEFEERLDLMRAHCQYLGRLGIEVWTGGRSAGVARIARDCCAAVNLWQAPVGEVSATRLTGSVTWAGKTPRGGFAEAVELYGDIRDAGATWAVLLVGGAVGPTSTVEFAVGIQTRLRQ